MNVGTRVKTNDTVRLTGELGPPDDPGSLLRVGTVGKITRFWSDSNLAVVHCLELDRFIAISIDKLEEIPDPKPDVMIQNSEKTPMLSFVIVELPRNEWHKCAMCQGTGNIYEQADAHRSAGPCLNCLDGMIKTKKIYRGDPDYEKALAGEGLCHRVERHPTFTLHDVIYELTEDPQKRAQLLHALTGKMVYIWSGEHNAYWRPDRSGYVTERRGAGIYQFEDAWRASSHCGPEKRISYVVYELPTSVSSISDEELLRRAVRNARPRRGKTPRWNAIMEVFLLGSTFAQQLCHRFGIDPEEKV